MLEFGNERSNIDGMTDEYKYHYRRCIDLLAISDVRTENELRSQLKTYIEEAYGTIGTPDIDDEQILTLLADADLFIVDDAEWIKQKDDLHLESKHMLQT